MKFNHVITAVFAILIIIKISEYVMDERPSAFRTQKVNILQQPIDIKDFTLLGEDGKFYKLDSLLGNGTILAFWAPWCKYCAQEFPHIDEIAKDLSDNGIKIIPIVKANESKDKILGFYESLKIDNLPIFLSGDRDMYKKLGVKGFPTFILVDNAGNAVATARPKWDSKNVVELFEEINGKSK
jgi:thiol-disulfide isomerase/thioredoxin